MRSAIVALALVLASCAVGPVIDPGTRVVSNTVAVPYKVPCIVDKDLPALPKRTPVDTEKATTDQLAAAYAADVEQFEEYAKAADALLRACVRSYSKSGGADVRTAPAH